MISKKALKNKKGFTLIEVMISVGLLAFFVLNASSLLVDMQRLTQQLQSQSDDETDLSLAVTIVDKIIHDVGPSFGLIRGNTDDNGKEFFDFMPDMSLDGMSPADATRTLTLSASANKFDFIFAVSDPSQTDVVHYNPVSAYAPVNPIVTMLNSAVLNYTGINSNNVVSSKFASFWIPGKYVLMRVPIMLRYVANGAIVNMNSNPREHSFVGKIVGNDLVWDNLLNTYLFGTHPLTLAPIVTADNFLRTIPTVGGASPLVLMELIKFYKISLVLNQTTQRYDLYAYEWASGAFSNARLISPDIQEVIFSRGSIARPIVSVTIKKY